MLHLVSLCLLAASPSVGEHTADGCFVAPASSPQEARAASDDVVERPRRRIVVLEGGGVLRGLSRQVASGDWEVKGRGGWTDVPERAIASVELEREILDRFEERRDDDEMSPADLVEWTFDAGLLKEAFQLGDRLLAEHPRDSDLRAVCANASRFVAGMPDRGADDELDRLRDLGSLGSPVVREAVVARLVTAAPRAEVLAALQEDLRSHRATRRTFAMMALGRLFPNEDPRALLLHSVYDPAEDARAEAARALAEMGALEVAAPLVRALDSKSPRVRTRAAEALGHTGEDAFVAPLVDRLYTLSRPTPQSGGGGAGPPHANIFVGRQRAYVQDFDVEVAQFSAVADPVINTLLEGSVLDVGVIGVDQIVEVRVERRAVRGALGRITGQDFGSSSKAWLEWWEDDASLPYRDGPTDGRRGDPRK
ncbi:MAG: HEAT repeat domain-containing protein [Planctomycetota bacterium]